MCSRGPRAELRILPGSHGCTASPGDHTLSLAEEAASRLAARVVAHGWSLPPRAFRMKVDFIASRAFVTFLAGDGSSFVAERFRAEDRTTYRRAALRFVGAFDRHRLIPETGLRL